jgi:hypothetical protein
VLFVHIVLLFLACGYHPTPAKQKDDVNFAYFNDNVDTVTQHTRTGLEY